MIHFTARHADKCTFFGPSWKSLYFLVRVKKIKKIPPELEKFTFFVRVGKIYIFGSELKKLTFLSELKKYMFLSELEKFTFFVRVGKIYIFGQSFQLARSSRMGGRRAIPGHI